MIGKQINERKHSSLLHLISSLLSRGSPDLQVMWIIPSTSPASWWVPRAQPWIHQGNLELCGVMEGEEVGFQCGTGRVQRRWVGTSIALWYPFTLLCVAGERTHGFSRTAVICGSVVVIRVYPHLLNMLTLVDSQVKSGLSPEVLGKQDHPPSLWSRHCSVCLDIVLWHWLKPVGAGASKF